MTVTYTHKVASSKGFGCFGKLLFRWRGSIYKLVWPDLLLYAVLYASCSITYRLLLTEPQKRVFESVAIYCGQFTDLIPVAFVLGFFVSIVVQRWWEQYMSLPWPDALALFVSTCIVGQNDRSRLMRRTIMRYVNLTFVITLSMISPRVKKRFPTLEHMLDAGLITPTEKKIFDDLDSKTSHPKYWMPLVWAGAIVSSARKERRIRDDFAVKTLLDEISKFRGLCGGLLSYDWISIPLVYTQVVTLAVYTFFLGTIMGRQFLDPAQNLPNQRVDLYVPWFTFLQFFFYMGWLKVAETLVNPFGEDDDDFEINWLIDRNLQVSYLIVDEMHEEHPDMIPDIHWDDVFPVELPYTIAAEQFKRMAPQGSTFNIEVPEEDQEISMPVLKEEPSDGEEDRKMTKINMKMSSDSLQSLGSGIAMKPIYRSSGMVGHKGSFLSAIVNKLRPSGSFSSMRRQTRTASRLSNSSGVTTKSKDSLPAYEISKRNRRRGFALRKGAVDSKLIIPKEDWLTEGKYSKEINFDSDGSIVIRIKRASTEVPNSSVKQAPPSPGEVVGSFSSGVTVVAPSPPKESPRGDITPKKKSTGNLMNSASQQSSDVFVLERLLSQELGSDDDRHPENAWVITDSSSDSDCEKRDQTCFVEDNNFPSLKRNRKPYAKYSKAFEYPSVQNSSSTGTVIENPLAPLTENETTSFLPKEGEEQEEGDREGYEKEDDIKQTNII